MADLRNTRFSIYLRNQLLDALGLAAFNSCKILIYSGVQPVTPETAIGAQVLLDTITGNAVCFPAPPAAANGVATANATTAGVAVAAGTAAWFRVTNSAGTQVLCDGSVGPSGGPDTYNLALSSVAVTVGLSLNASSFTLTLPMQGL